MAENETWYHVYQGQSAGPLTGEQMERLVQTGQITLETLVWPGVGEWVPAGLTRLAPLFPQRPLVPDPVLSPAQPRGSDRRAFLKDKPRLRVALQIAVGILGLYAVYNGIGQMREGVGELRDPSEASPSLAQINFQGCRAVGPESLECAYQNNGAVEAKACMDVVVVCDDARHVASSCSDPIAPGQRSTKVINNFSPPGIAAATGCAPMQFENVKVQ